MLRRPPSAEGMRMGVLMRRNVAVALLLDEPANLEEQQR
jgi:hypothetical protein